MRVATSRSTCGSWTSTARFWACTRAETRSSSDGEERRPMNDMRQMTSLGRGIEDKSFAIIDHEAGAHGYGAPEWQVVRRIIHATADFEFKSLARFHPGAVEAGVRALRSGATRSEEHTSEL